MSRGSKKLKSTRKQSKFSSLLIVVAVLIVSVVIFVKVSDLRNRSRELKETEKSLELQIEKANNEREELNAKEQYMKTNQYIEDVAKDKFGLVYPDEIVIKPAE